MTTTATPQKLSDLATPAFVVNRHSFHRNCELVRTSAYANGIHHLRPHVKTHKTKEGCLIQAGMGDGGGGGGGTPASTVIGFVVSTIPELSMVVDMACQHQCRPFSDILFGLPICRSKLSAIQKLKIKLSSVVNDGNIHLLVDNPDQIDFLESFILNSTSAEMQWSVFLKLDTGYHRAGTTCDGQGVSLATRIIESPYISLKGLYSHCGHSYSVNTEEEMKKIVRDDHNNILELLTLLTDHLKDNDNTFDTSSLDISVGSTPSMFAHNGLTNASNNFELHPGNYVFYDRQQLYTGACANESYIAGFVLTRVIGHYKDERNAIMVDAGATALTKEVTAQGDVCAVFGLPGLECYRMSQEVTMIRRRNGGDTPFPFEDFPLGSTMLLLPNHSCLAAACFDVYHVVDETESPFFTANVVDTWKPAKGWA
ncbi:hypothetical protein ACHAXR_008817 [Thalassiosira sp. AJA248-18]